MRTVSDGKFSRILSSLLCLILINHGNGGYLYGGTSQECWTTDLTTGIQVYVSGGCPSTIDMAWIDSGSSTVVYGVSELLKYKLSVDIPGLVRDKKTHTIIYHGNYHSCITSNGACIPNVAVTPGLVTQSAVLSQNLSRIDNTTIFSSELSLSVGSWTVVAHVRFKTSSTQYDVAVGFLKKVVEADETLTIEDGSKVALITISCLTGSILFAALLFLLSQRKRKVVRYSSALFSIIMLIGCVSGSLSAIPFAYVNNTACALRPLLLVVSFTLIFTPLILKTYRIFKIFGTKRISAVVIKDFQLGIGLAVFLAVDAIILACWLGIPSARPKPDLYLTSTANTYEWRCYSAPNHNIATAVIVYKSFVLVVGLILAFLGRNAPSLFNESWYITISFLVFFAIFIIGIALESLVSSQPNVVFSIRAMAIILSCIMVAVTFFVPKFILLLTHKDEDIQGFNDPKASGQSGVNRSKRIYSCAVSEFTEGTEDENATVHLKKREVIAFAENGVLPEEVSGCVDSLHSESDTLRKKSTSGLKVLAIDLHRLRDVAKEYTEYCSLLEKQDKAVDRSSIKANNKKSSVVSEV